MPVSQKLVFAFPDGRMLYEYSMKNEMGFEMKALNLGCTITSLFVPDREGKTVDVVLGFDKVEDYFNSPHYLGCVVGRYANRIAHGKFNIDGKSFELSQNDHGHHLHGGINGLNKKIWQASVIESSQGCGVDFSCVSYDGEEGYPGNLALTVRYFLSHDGTVSFTYNATTDQKTIINLTQHSYFNLTGKGDSILNHQLKIYADYFLPVDQSFIPTGEFKPVAGTAFDFKEFKVIGRNMELQDQQISIAKGYDHTMILNKNSGDLTYAASLYEPNSGRHMDVYTTEPGLQLYTSNFLQGIGKHNNVYMPYSGVCLETQHFPDTPNRPEFPGVVLEPGIKYKSETILKFSVDTYS